MKRLQLDDHLHILAVQGRAHQRIDDVRILGHTVEVDPNGRDLGVQGRFAQEIRELGEIVVGVMQEDVALGDLVQNAGPAL